MADALVDLANRFANEHDCDLLLLNASINRSIERRVFDCINNRKDKKKRAALVLCTEGGDPDAAFKIGRHLQTSYEDHSTIVAGWCKSAGTLICIAANRILMGEYGELGPLDVQLAKPDDLAGVSSGLTLDSALRSLKAIGFDIFEHFMLDTIQKSGGRITTRTASEISAGITVGLLAPIFDQIDPVKIGEDYRSTRIAEEYAERLNIRSKNLIVNREFNALEALVRGYPSHGFVIDRTEAQSLFKNVEPLPEELNAIAKALGKIAIVPQSSLRDETEFLQYLNDYGAKNAQPAATGVKRQTAGKGSREAPARQSAGDVPANPAKGVRDVPLPAKRRRASKKTRPSKSD